MLIITHSCSLWVECVSQTLVEFIFNVRSSFGAFFNVLMLLLQINKKYLVSTKTIA